MFDNVFFKLLSHNDSGAAVGHQGGILIPAGLAVFFPPIPDEPSPENPTVDITLKAKLLVNGNFVDTVETRYQYQTWGGTRQPERRLTDNLGALRNQSVKDDAVVFSRNIDEDGIIQINLIKKKTTEYDSLFSNVNARWGVLDSKRPPVLLSEILGAQKYLEDELLKMPSAFSDMESRAETVSVRKARDRAFRNSLLSSYGRKCAITARTFLSPVSEGLVGLDAAHIVPVASGGSDHPCNGLPMTKELHWAFDRGLFGISHARTVVVPQSVSNIVGNEFLRDLNGAAVAEPCNVEHRILDEAIDWHRSNILIK